MSYELKITDLGQVNTGGTITSGKVADLVTRAEAKNYIKQQYGTLEVEDSLIDIMIQAARQWIEGYIKQSIIKKTIVAYTRDELARFVLPLAPVQSITSVKKVDFEGNETALVLNTDYLKDGNEEIALYFYHVWGTVSGGAVAGIKVEYEAYMSEVPKPLKLACMKLVAENYYKRGESENEAVSIVPFDVRTLCNPFRRFQL